MTDASAMPHHDCFLRVRVPEGVRRYPILPLNRNTSGKMSHLKPHFSTEREHYWQMSHKIVLFVTKKEH
jgi:hypothetical protein